MNSLFAIIWHVQMEFDRIALYENFTKGVRFVSRVMKVLTAISISSNQLLICALAHA